jgi:hypothetical protein
LSKIAPKKTVGPSTLLTFLGIELDTVRQEARLPLEKIQKCLSMVDMFLRRKKVTLEELQCLLQPRLILHDDVVSPDLSLIQTIDEEMPTLEVLPDKQNLTVHRGIVILPGLPSSYAKTYQPYSANGGTLTLLLRSFIR